MIVGANGATHKWDRPFGSETQVAKKAYPLSIPVIEGAGGQGVPAARIREVA